MLAFKLLIRAASPTVVLQIVPVASRTDNPVFCYNGLPNAGTSARSCGDESRWKVASVGRSASASTSRVRLSTEMAAEQRTPEGTIHYSDQWTQDTALALRRALQEHRRAPRVDAIGDCYQARSARASSLRSNVKSSSASPTPADRRRAFGSSITSRASIIQRNCTQRSTTRRP